jgi:hypothetical protein
MAVIAITQKNTLPGLVTKTTLTTGPDTLAYVAGSGMIMELENTTASSITVTLLGASASASYVVAGTGGTTINAAAGKAYVIAAGTTQSIPLDLLSVYLQGAVTLTSSAAGAFCSVVTGS